MLIPLVKARIASVLYTMNFSEKNSKRRAAPMKGLTILLAAYVAVMLAVMSTLIFLPLCRPFVDAGYSWFYFAFAGIMSFIICFIGSVFSTQSQLFEAKDNELLLSMPISPSVILLSRMVFLVLMNYVYEAFIMVPAFVVFWATVPEMVSTMTVLMFVLCFLTLPLLSLSVSALFGWMLSLITSKMRRKNIFITVASFVLLGLYFSVYFRIEGYMERLINNGAEIASAVQNAIFPAYSFGKAISDGNITEATLFVMLCLVPFVALNILISIFFQRIVTDSGEQKKKTQGRFNYKKYTPGLSLFKKELSYFLSRPQYIMNSALGVIFAVVFSLLIALNGDAVVSTVGAVFSGTENSIPEMLCLSLCLLISFSFISAPSLSLEGKNLWFIKSIPVDPKTVLMSKVMLHVAVCVPLVLVSSTVCVLSVKMNPFQTILFMLAPIAVAVFEAFFGVTVNLSFPKFDWTSETVVIKQSAATVITMFSTLGIVGIPTFVFAELMNNGVQATVFLTVFTAGFIIASVMLYRYLSTRGVRKFQEMQS